MTVRFERSRPCLRALRDPGGAAAVEFAFALPILLALTLGAFEIGNALYTQAQLEHAAKETARFASVRGLASGVVVTRAELEAMAKSLAGLEPASVNAVVNWQPDNRPGSIVAVQLDHAYTPLSATLFTDGGFTMSANAAMTVVR